MSVLSVPLTPALSARIDELVASGVASNKADLARKAIERFAEEQAVRAVLEAEKEPNLEGDLDDLMSKV